MGEKEYKKEKDQDSQTDKGQKKETRTDRLIERKEIVKIERVEGKAMPSKEKEEQKEIQEKMLG